MGSRPRGRCCTRRLDGSCVAEVQVRGLRKMTQTESPPLGMEWALTPAHQPGSGLRSVSDGSQRVDGSVPTPFGTNVPGGGTPLA